MGTGMTVEGSVLPSTPGGYSRAAPHRDLNDYPPRGAAKSKRIRSQNQSLIVKNGIHQAPHFHLDCKITMLRAPHVHSERKKPTFSAKLTPAFFTILGSTKPSSEL